MFIMETDIASVQDRQRTLDGKFSHMEKNAEFVNQQIIELKTALQASTDKRKDEVSECRKQVLYLEAYNRRENLKFEGIPELAEATVQQNVASHENGKCHWKMSLESKMRKTLNSRRCLGWESQGWTEAAVGLS